MQLRLVDLIRQLSNNDGVPNAVATADLVNGSPCTHLDNSAAGAVSAFDSLTPIDKSGGRKIGAGYKFDQIIYRNLGILD